MGTLKTWLTAQGLSESYAAIVTALCAAGALLLLTAVLTWIARKALLRVVRSMARRTKTHWDDALVESKFFARLTHFVPAVVIHALAPLVFQDFLQIVTGVDLRAINVG